MNFETFYTSFFATMAFGIIFNVPKRSMISGGIIGMLGWALYIWLTGQYHFDMVFATLIAAFFVATVSQLLARYHKMPVTVFSVSGIIPLVPGGLAYDTMRHFVENDYSIAIKYATKTLLISGAIAFGLIFSGVISQILRRNDNANVKED
ncbi:threonine/serine exporter family protein [Tepidibacillus infernus]|uniref:Threonine/Serine exporter ThrE domain-containing protein n=1 Tax=Tepidibacillus decaturensis TaxID=1413211 RepID=A0A135L772_9BACI|nr:MULTISPECIES: threonine/serine exporter family protein [Tepidibacillus]KXG44855.1 hypothetical protein U473_13145 [Tepidibacillus decaturensis]